MRYCLIPVKMANYDNRPELENWDIQTLLGGMYNGTALSETRLQLPKELIIINYLSTPRFLAKRKANTCPGRHHMGVSQMLYWHRTVVTAVSIPQLSPSRTTAK